MFLGFAENIRLCLFSVFIAQSFCKFDQAVMVDLRGLMLLVKLMAYFDKERYERFYI